MFGQISTHEKQEVDKGVTGNIAKQLKLSNMSGCIHNTENSNIKDTAYIIEKEREGLSNHGEISYS